jgi:hypothetical protein
MFETDRERSGIRNRRRFVHVCSNETGVRIVHMLILEIVVSPCRGQHIGLRLSSSMAI